MCSPVNGASSSHGLELDHRLSVKIPAGWNFPGGPVHWLRLCAPRAEGLGSMPGQGTKSHMPQLVLSTAKSINIKKQKQKKLHWMGFLFCHRACLLHCDTSGVHPDILEHLPPHKNRSLPTVLLCALTSDFTGGCPPPPSRSLCQRVNLQLQFIKFLVILPFNFQLSLHLERGTHHAY